MRESNLNNTCQFFGPGGLSRSSGGLPCGASDASKPFQRRELFLTGGFAESIELRVPIRQKVRWSVKLNDSSVLEEHDPVVIYHGSQPVRDR